ncbi:hypothetical protein K458DRAFT_102504 [Lentithecium fluviatile CBS 122367]|uniref:Uncharacterized protein n=1 Tax=Lentithecium fluviatile CBS 122367 TaxID=1168545 RepID=A0A6G1JJQ0_9PLEO|nr:hypothetical protein K458DRAFT_102504 [Lentithecium fluviatile CBS 122367]
MWVSPRPGRAICSHLGRTDVNRLRGSSILHDSLRPLLPIPARLRGRGIYAGPSCFSLLRGDVGSIAAYNETLQFREAAPSFTLLAADEADRTTRMATSCSTSLIAPSQSMTFLEYVPKTKPKTKPKAKPKAESMSTAHINGNSSLEAAPAGADEGWLDIDGFLMPDLDASPSVDTRVAAQFTELDEPLSLGQVDGLGASAAWEC